MLLNPCYSKVCDTARQANPFATPFHGTDSLLPEGAVAAQRFSDVSV
jgi:hypothetical protein